MSDFQQQYALWDEFLKVWPAPRLATMTPDEYTQAGSKDSFTYWIESRLDEMGSIWGGSAFKFGVFSRKDTEDKKSDAKLSYSETHGWYSSLGATGNEAFQKVRGYVTQVADFAAQGDLDGIEAFKQHQAEHYRRLSSVRTEGGWEGRVSFFLEGVAVAAADAERSIIAVASPITADRKRLLESVKAGPISYRLFELLPMMPRFSVEHVRQRLETTFPTATAAVKLLEDLGILVELTGQKKNRVYSYQAYAELPSR